MIEHLDKISAVDELLQILAIVVAVVKLEVAILIILLLAIVELRHVIIMRMVLMKP